MKASNSRATGMVARFLPVNQAWVVMFGDSIIDLDGKRFFDMRELKGTLASKGLALDGRTGQVYTPEVQS